MNTDLAQIRNAMVGFRIGCPPLSENHEGAKSRNYEAEGEGLFLISHFPSVVFS